MTDKIVPFEKGICNCCMDENVKIFQCPIKNCNYYLCTKCINKIKNNNILNGKCPACRNINNNLNRSQINLNIEEINIEEIEAQRPIWINRHYNLLDHNYKPICTTCYFNPFKIYYTTNDPYYKIRFKYYYGTYNNISNLYTISLFNRCVYDFFFGLFCALFLINALIFGGRTLIWLCLPWPTTYWVPFLSFILLGIVGCFLLFIGLVLCAFVIMIIGSILELFVMTCLPYR